jgi:type VI secretion system protein ImpF
MSENQRTGGARALLFERLVDVEPERKEEPFRVLSRKELRRSVSRELGRLLNTRCPVPLRRLGEEARTVINYGLPDFTSLSPQNAGDCQLIAGIIAETVTAYEPRLRNVRVRVEHFEDEERTLHIAIDGDLVTDTVVEVHSHSEHSSAGEPISFPVVLHSRTGILEVD